jgi:phage/plasmid-associated DNA primase
MIAKYSHSPTVDWVVTEHDNQARYCTAKGRWDDTEAVMASAQETVEAMVSDAMTENNHQQRLSSARHAINSGARARIDAMLYLARPHLSVRLNDLDSDPMLFNVANGTLDLRTFKLEITHPSALITSSRRFSTIHSPCARTGCASWRKSHVEIRRLSST